MNRIIIPIISVCFPATGAMIRQESLAFTGDHDFVLAAGTHRIKGVPGREGGLPQIRQAWHAKTGHFSDKQPAY
jgi:hypothetical protein